MMVVTKSPHWGSVVASQPAFIVCKILRKNYSKMFISFHPHHLWQTIKHLVSDQCQVSQQPHPSIHTWHLNITNTLCFQVFQDTETILKPLDYNYTHFNSHLAPKRNKHIVSKILETILNSILSQLCALNPHGNKTVLQSILNSWNFDKFQLFLCYSDFHIIMLKQEIQH